MNRGKIRIKVNEILCDLFNDNSIIITDETSAGDIKDWDSLSNIDIIILTEETFKIKISSNEMANFTRIGDLIDIIEKKTA